MKIKRSENVFISSEVGATEKKKYCPVCERYKLRRELHKKVYDLDDPNQCPFGQLPADHDLWLQCYACGSSFDRRNIAQEGSLSTELEITKPSIYREDEHLPKPKHRRGFNERLQNQEPEIKDPEVRKELKKGHKLISYSEK